jgi:hypothetical protein
MNMRECDVNNNKATDSNAKSENNTNSNAKNRKNQKNQKNDNQECR